MTKVEELRESVVEGVVRALEQEGKVDGGLIGAQIVDSLISAAKQEGVVEYLVKRLVDTVEAGNVEIANSLATVRRCLDKLEAEV